MRAKRLILAVALACLVWCQFLDGIVTLFGVRLGLLQEANPIMAGCIDHWWCVALKVLVALVLACAIWWRAARNVDFAIKGAQLLAGASAVIVAWNLMGFHMSLGAQA